MNEKRTFSKALRQLSPIKRAILNEKEPADDLLLSAEQDVFEGLNAHTLLACAFSKDLPPAYQRRYATIILDRAPWAALEDNETSDKKKPDLHAEKNSYFVDRALVLNDEALAIRLAQSGARVTKRQLDSARNKKQNSFLEFAFSNACSKQDIFMFLRDEYLPARELEWVQSCLRTHYTIKEQREVLSHVIKRNSFIQKFLDDFTNRVLVPSYLLMQSADSDMEKNAFNPADKAVIKDLFLHALFNQPSDDEKSPVNLYDTLSKLAYTWRNPKIHLPNLPYDQSENTEECHVLDREWYPLISKPFTTSSGYTIYNRTHEHELKKDYLTLGHCIDEYAEKCCSLDSDRAHIFTIIAPDGKAQSSFHLQVADKPNILYPSVRIGKKYLLVIEHEGKEINDKKDHIQSGPLHMALQEFLSDLKTGKLKLQPEPYGETEASKRANNLPEIIKNCGYYPTWHNVDVTLQEFKKDLRRGATSIDRNGQLIYDKVIAVDGSERHIHLIDGDVMQGGKTLSLRNMNSQEYLHATGMAEAMHALAGKPYQPPEKLTATLPPPETREQYTARGRTYDARFASGTLYPEEVKTLNQPPKPSYPGEMTPVLSKAAIAYAGRLRELNPPKDKPYFDR